MGEAIQDIPGVEVSLNKTGTYDYSIRGFGSEYTLLLIDGKRQSVANGFYGNGFGGSESGYLPPLNMIERIEVIRGPASTLYGTDAVGGVINIITKKMPDKLIAGIEASGQLQQHDDKYGNARSLSAYVGTPIGESFSALVRGKYYHKNASKTMWPDSGYIENINTGAITPRDPKFQIPSHNPGFYNSLNIGTRLNYTPNEEHSFYFDYNRYVNTINTRSTSSSAVAVKRMLFKDDIILNYDGSFSFGTSNSYLQYGRTNDRDYDITSEIWVAESKAVLPFDMKSFGSLALSVGARVDYEVLNNNNSSASVIRGQDIDQTTAALYGEGEYFITDDLIFTAGLRYVYSDLFSSEFTPRAYLVYHINDLLTLKGGIARGYKTPPAKALTDGYYATNTDGTSNSFGNPDLKPETSTNYELGVNFDAFGYANYSLTAFLTDFKNELDTEYIGGIFGTIDCDDASVTCTRDINHGKTRTKGLEFAMNTAKFKGFSFDSSYTFMEKTYEDGTLNVIGTDRITNKPKHIVMTKLNYEFGSYSAFLKFRGKFDTIAQSKGGGASPITNRAGAVMEKYKPFYIFDLGLNYKIDKQQSLSFVVYNLFDKDFFDPLATMSERRGQRTYGYANRYQDYTEGRSFWLSYKYDF